MFSTCSELTPRAPIPDGRMERIMRPCFVNTKDKFFLNCFCILLITCFWLLKTQDDQSGPIVATQFEPMWARQVQKVCTPGVPQHVFFLVCPRRSPALTSQAEKPLSNWSWGDQKSTTPGQTQPARKRENRLMADQAMCGTLIRPPQKCRPMS